MLTPGFAVILVRNINMDEENKARKEKKTVT